MVPSLSRTVEIEVLSLSKSLENKFLSTVYQQYQASNEYTMELLELVDTLEYEDSINLCVNYLVSNICYYADLRKLLSEKIMSQKSKAKLKGMFMQKKIEEARSENKYGRKLALDDLTLMAKDMTI